MRTHVRNNRRLKTEIARCPAVKCASGRKDGSRCSENLTVYTHTQTVLQCIHYITPGRRTPEKQRNRHEVTAHTLTAIQTTYAIKTIKIKLTDKNTSWWFCVQLRVNKVFLDGEIPYVG